MKLLISAYACRPNKGSEPAVGWSWVLELSRYHDLFVLTNYTNEPYIEAYRKQHPEILQNVIFVYIRPPRWMTFWYKEWERMERAYYLLWQRKAYHVAKQLNAVEHFDCVQHLTYVTCVLPTYMHKLGIPFVYGPLSGGERIPECIGLPMKLKDHLVEFVRKCVQLHTLLSPNTRAAFAQAAKIVVVTEETKQLVPRKYWDKTIVSQAIGLPETFFVGAAAKTQIESEHMPCKILMTGRLLAWKGFEMGIEAVKIALDQGAKIELTITGNERFDQIQRLTALAGKYYGKQIQMAEPVPFEKMKEYYDSFDVLLNCSMRDSGCLVVMEAMARGLPIVCVDAGGPKVNTTEKNAIKIQPKPYREMTQEIAEALMQLASLPEKRRAMSSASYDYAREKFDMTKKISAFLKVYEEAVAYEEVLV